jgi:hypothetical protein
MDHIKNFISATDFISEKPQILLNKSVRSKTIYGGLFSIICIALILFAIITFAIGLIQRKNSTLSYNKVPTENSVYDFGQYPIMIALLDNGLKLIEEEDRYYNFLADIWSFTPNNSTGTVVMQLNRTTIQTEKCKLDKHFGKYQNYFKDVPYLEHHYCIVPGQNITLHGIYGSIKPYNFLDLWISTCVNNTLINRTDCYSRETSQKRLVNTYISYQYLTNFIDHSNIDIPGGLILQSEILPVSSTIYKRDFFYHRNINYYTDFDFIFSSENRQNYNQMVQFRETADLRPEGTVPGSFALISVLMDNSYDEYKRRFTKFQEVLANLGGLFKGICTIAFILNYIFFDELYYINIMSGIFKNDYLKAPGIEVNRDISLKLKSSLKPNCEEVERSLTNLSGSLVNIAKANKTNQINLTKLPLKNTKKNFDSHLSKTSTSKLDSRTLQLGFLELICVRCPSDSLLKRKKIQVYRFAKEYTENLLCINNILNSHIDLNKLKCFIFNEEQHLIYNQIPTPSIMKIAKSTSNIWEDFILKSNNQKLDTLLTALKIKLNKSEIDLNILKVVQKLESNEYKQQLDINY